MVRFLFVYQDFAAQARDLVQELLVGDVRVIVARKGEDSPNAQELRLLEEFAGAEAAACQLGRKYRRTVQPYVTFTVEPKKFRFDDQTLRAWLVGQEERSTEVTRPSDAFAKASNASARLALHQGALTSADKLDVTRWPFAHKAATLLQRRSSGENLGPMREWHSRHGVAFAANGQVSYAYEVRIAGAKISGSTEWHLKAGDQTTPERAARIYFDVIGTTIAPVLLVFFVGPHPPDGAYFAHFAGLDLTK